MNIFRDVCSIEDGRESESGQESKLIKGAGLCLNSMPDV